MGESQRITVEERQGGVHLLIVCPKEKRAEADQAAGKVVKENSAFPGTSLPSWHFLLPLPPPPLLIWTP